MMNLDDLLGNIVSVSLPGKAEKTGYLVDYGDDILVLYDGRQYHYIPFTHIQQLCQPLTVETIIQEPDESQIGVQTPQITLHEMLTHAVGTFIEIWAAGSQPLFGTLAALQDDYLVLNSPVYKTIYIALDHLKWLIPYDGTHVPYALPQPAAATADAALPPLPTFSELVQSFVGQLVVFDMGNMSDKIGLLHQVNSNQILELITADGQKLYWNLQHLKTVHLP